MFMKNRLDKTAEINKMVYLHNAISIDSVMLFSITIMGLSLDYYCNSNSQVNEVLSHSLFNKVNEEELLQMTLDKAKEKAQEALDRMKSAGPDSYEFKFAISVNCVNCDDACHLVDYLNSIEWSVENV